MISKKYKCLFLLTLVLAVLSLVISGCSGGANQSVTFSQLISQADQYNGKIATFEAFYFAGFEISALSALVGPSTFGNGRIAPVGTLIWVRSGISEDLFNKLYTQTQTPSGYPEHIGKLKISGKFETGSKYGHLDAYQYQISITSAEQLEWSPPPAVTPTPLTGDLQFKVTDLSGKPLSGAKVVSEEQPAGQLKVTGMTDSNGTVTFKDIKPGEYRFYVSGAGFLQQNNVAAAVSDGQTTSITISMAEN